MGQLRETDLVELRQWMRRAQKHFAMEFVDDLRTELQLNDLGVSHVFAQAWDGELEQSTTRRLDESRID